MFKQYLYGSQIIAVLIGGFGGYDTFKKTLKANNAKNTFMRGSLKTISALLVVPPIYPMWAVATAGCASIYGWKETCGLIFELWNK